MSTENKVAGQVDAEFVEPEEAIRRYEALCGNIYTTNTELFKIEDQLMDRKLSFKQMESLYFQAKRYSEVVAYLSTIKRNRFDIPTAQAKAQKEHTEKSSIIAPGADAVAAFTNMKATE